MRKKISADQCETRHVLGANDTGCETNRERHYTKFMTKVVHLTTVHQPSDVRIHEKQCRALAEAGYSVVLIAPQGDFRAVPGVRVHLLRPLPTRLQRMTVGSWIAWREAVSEKATVYHIHDPELIPVSWLLRARGHVVFYDVHEDMPQDILIKPYLPPITRRPLALLAKAIERLTATVLSGIVAATPKIAARFPNAKTCVVRNFPRQEEFPRPRRSSSPTKTNEVIYVGGLSRERGAAQMVNAAKIWNATVEAPLVLAGRILPRSLETELESLDGWRHVQFLGWLNRDELLARLARAKLGLVVLHPHPSFLDSLPVKLFEYMAAGLPVVASRFPLWEQIIDNAECGVTVNPFDENAIASAVQTMLTSPDMAAAMGSSGRQAIAMNYSWELESRTLIDFYADALGKRRPWRRHI